MPAPSPKQLEVLGFIEQFIADKGLPPTRGEIAQGLGLRNRQGIDQHLRALQAKGVIELVPGISRGIRIREDAPASAFPRMTNATNGSPRGRNPSGRLREEIRSAAAAIETTGLPLLGRIAAGSPILAIGNIEERLQVDPQLFQPRADFLLRVHGDSMKDADIFDRDLLAVHQTSQARNGQIIVARLGDEATVKRYRRQGSVVRLEPANDAYQPLEIDLQAQEFSIEGLAVGVIRTGQFRAR